MQAQGRDLSSQLPDNLPLVSDSVSSAERSVGHLSALVHDLHDATVRITQAPPSVATCENRLIEVRLGIASSLLAALRQKHSPAARHSLRVALGCSSWAFAIGMESAERDEIEVAALLHDIGKIGAPDRLLLKPGPLEGDEVKLMDQYRLAGLDILANCCPSPAIVDIIRHSAAWYDGQRANYPLVAKNIPLGARMLAIVDAFDSMTTDQVYRQALSRERALHELLSHAGTQFDPDLVRSFGQLNISIQLHQKVLSHWLKSLDPQHSNRFWQSLPPAEQPQQAVPCQALFRQKLLDNMYDAVIFVDCNLRIVQWNRGAERLTGISSASVLEHHWSTKLVDMRDEHRGELAGMDCPITYCLNTGVQSLRRLIVSNRHDRPIAVDVHTVPVVGPDGTNHGAAMLLHDASPEATLEAQCNSLHERATKDPLTQVANRAEFDRMHQAFLKAHLERNLSCSLIICDIDYFKSVNDTYGHLAGDEVLRAFGRLLKSECRSGDLVARYGGEEFVLLCADCNNATATRRAEEMRRLISELPLPALNGNFVTVSFGVTEVQPGDTAESMLRRADRALLEAKNLGRNTVVQLGDGLGSQDDGQSSQAAGKPNGETFIDTVLVTAVPVNIAVEKLRGFVLDHHAEILGVRADRIDLQIEAQRRQLSRRRSDRPVPFLVELCFSEQRVPIRTAQGQAATKMLRTRVRVTIRLKRSRDRRGSAIMQQAQCILAAIQSYLMANQETKPAEPGTTRLAVNMLAPWLKLRR
jgi:diguanylate cyclase (GGDEF)-like protein/PAS domain S-box-containing protein